MLEIFAYPLCTHVFELISLAFIALYVEIAARMMRPTPSRPPRSIVRRAL